RALGERERRRRVGAGLARLERPLDGYLRPGAERPLRAERRPRQRQAPRTRQGPRPRPRQGPSREQSAVRQQLERPVRAEPVRGLVEPLRLDRRPEHAPVVAPFDVSKPRRGEPRRGLFFVILSEAKDLLYAAKSRSFVASLLRMTILI